VQLSGDGSSFATYSTQQAASLRALSSTQLSSALTAAAKEKLRPRETHDGCHVPMLTGLGASDCIKALMIGDSMLQHMSPGDNTGSHTKLGKAPFPYVFNAGVGGDSIANGLYRLDRGLLEAFHGCRVSNAIIHVGTNDLKPQRALSKVSISQYALMIEALQRACLGINVLVTGLMPRRDVSQQFVDDSNRSLQQLVSIGCIGCACLGIKQDLVHATRSLDRLG
jgi:hypothetical protein